MKTTLKQLTAVILFALFLFVGNVYASNYEVKSLKAVETAIQLESWMTNEVVWNTANTKFVDFTQETEVNRGLESWMTNSSSWETSYNVTEEFESILELENWMLDNENWNTEKKSADPVLILEPWMTDSKLWE